jgi:maltose alpha-D-glucosyltransferase/alpha-amylase
MSNRWYQRGVIYCLDVDTFQDGNGDGIGDLPGLIARLDHLARLGVTCLWLNPIHPSTHRDDGYDITDHYGIDPRIGTMGDFAELLRQAGDRGLRVIMDLVVNHTSDEHPWFQSARSDPDSPYRDWYVWSADEPEDRRQGMVFPGHQKETWTWDDAAGAWYYHRFYDFEPDLHVANPAVREEIRRIMGFWLQLGVSGFRVDAAPFLIEQTRPNEANCPHDFGLLDDLHDAAAWRRAEAVLLAEANVENHEVLEYFSDGRRLPMIFDFQLNQRTLLALARSEAAPIQAALQSAPKLPRTCQWATFLRNHDEADLGRLGEHERAEVFAAFGPEPTMQLYGRGIRRRLAPMLGGDQRRIQMAYALLCALPGTPVIRYGEEIGMGDDLSLPERAAIRTPMQWTHEDHGGFSTARKRQLVRRPISGGEYGFERVNVLAQRRDPSSLLSWLERVFRTMRECPEFGTGHAEPVDVGDRAVLVVHFESETGTMLALTNLAADPRVVDASSVATGQATEIFGDHDYGTLDPSLAHIELDGHGYRWIRLRWTIPSGPPSPPR